MKRIAIILFILFNLSGNFAQAQHDQKYYPPEEKAVLAKIEEWQGLKFGLLMHWGAYSQWGIVESWSICAEDEDWCRRDNPDYNAYKKDYENLITTFNPIHFDPNKWAKAAKNAGMKYVVFTTKHHDGYTMFDSKFTDYKITGSISPFKDHPKANIAKEVFNAFRSEGLWAGAYFSKPDWHSEDYWWPNFATPDRNVNYDINKYPHRWENFVQFTHNQIMELVTDYGPLDILWFDGGWVAKMGDKELQRRINSENYKFIHFQNQDIRMDELVSKVRNITPDIIVVDRAVEGINQNYLTPENRVPEKYLPYPWESCIIAGGSWSWIRNPKYLTAKETIHMLVDIVSKGGNLLLNIAPGPDGNWDNEAYTLLEDIGKWMKVNGEAIYETKAFAPYKIGNICFTQKEDITYLFYLNEKEEQKIPAQIIVQSFQPKTNSKIKLLGTNQELEWIQEANGIIIRIPEKLQKNSPSDYVWVFEVK